MAITVDELIVVIRAETQQLRKGLDQINKQVGRVDKSVNTSMLSFRRLGTVLAAVGIGRFAGETVNTIRKFEDLRATLKAVTGSAEGAGISMDLVRKFTAGTTFQLDEVTTSFITLLNAGITPTSGVLTDFGNVAAAFNKDLTTLSRAAFNATTGEMEMLKQFGIVARKEGEKLNVTFNGVTTQIDADGKAIIEFIRNIGREEFPTALEDSANTLSGRISNLQDATTEFMGAIGEGGLRTALIDLTSTFIENTNNSRSLATMIGQTLGAAVNGLNRAVTVVVNNLGHLATALVIAGSVKITMAILATASAFMGVAKGATAAKLALMALNKVSKKNVILMVAVGLGVLAEELFDLSDKLIDFAKQVGDFFGMEFPDAIDKTDKSLEELDAELENLRNGLQEPKKQLKKDAETVEEVFANLRDNIGQAVHGFTTDFVTGLMEGANALDQFKNLAKNIVAQIISTFLQLGVVNHILNAVFGSFINSGQMSAFPTIFNKGPSGTKVNTLPPIDIVAGRAGGGAMSRGRPYLVGERGPEIVIPHTAGTIMNSSRSMGGAGGTGVVVNQNINLSTGVQSTVRAEVTRMLPTISEITKAGVLEAAGRGGKFRRGLMGA